MKSVNTGLQKSTFASHSDFSCLVIHTTDKSASVKGLTGLVFFLTYLEELVRFAVSMFVIISGFVLYNKYKSDLPMREFKQRDLW